MAFIYIARFSAMWEISSGFHDAFKKKKIVCSSMTCKKNSCSGMNWISFVRIGGVYITENISFHITQLSLAVEIYHFQGGKFSLDLIISSYMSVMIDFKEIMAADSFAET